MPRQKLVGAATVLLVLLAWQLWHPSIHHAGNTIRFPAPLDLLLASWDWIAGGDLKNDLGASLLRGVSGFVVGCLAGGALGCATGYTRWVGAVVTPIASLLRPVPPMAVVPLVVMLLGIGNGAKIALVAFATFFPVWFHVHLGEKNVEERHLQMATLLGLGRWRTLIRVVLPAARSAIIAGARVGGSLAFYSLIAAELAGANSGLAYRIEQAHIARRLDLMLAAIIVLGIIGALLDLAYKELLDRLPGRSRRRSAHS